MMRCRPHQRNTLVFMCRMFAIGPGVLVQRTFTAGKEGVRASAPGRADLARGHALHPGGEGLRGDGDWSAVCSSGQSRAAFIQGWSSALAAGIGGRWHGSTRAMRASLMRVISWSSSI